ncbi:putative molybdopterin converting factor [Mobilicoccus pelagius NBRC 104925]|uniref:Putative molybdopterin converting factor n=2 Tax=Mobilicoccus TaxID=984996 RepID=H5UN45_9MICO|nr:putative molybdopterin converting factor [Mobilicoccus pelagius NBRC 104925]
MTVMLRYWAAAAAATGVDVEEAAPGAVASVLADAVLRHPDLARILDVASVLLDGVPVRAGAREETRAEGGSTLEVLPPFAGG